MRGTHEQVISIKKQGIDVLIRAFRNGIGRKKHEDKATENGTKDKVYMDTTFKTYKAAWLDFVRTMQAVQFTVSGHRPRTLEEAKEFVPEFIEILKRRPGKMGAPTMSPYSIWTKFSGVAKVLGLTASDYELPPRHSAEVRRSRTETVGDKHFSEENNRDLILFCRTVGLRNAKELTKIRGTDLYTPEGERPYILVKGKGGRVRMAHLYGSDEEIRRVIEMMHEAAENKVWPHVPSHADVHAFRADYAVRVYCSYARDVSTLSGHDRYCCRGAKKGIVYDREALQMTSEELGHSRESVMAMHYMHGLDQGK